MGRQAATMPRQGSAVDQIATIPSAPLSDDQPCEWSIKAEITYKSHPYCFGPE